MLQCRVREIMLIDPKALNQILIKANEILIA